MEGISIAKLLAIAALIVLLFGTNKLRSLGGDLGAAIKGFKKAINDDQSVKTTTAGDDERLPVKFVITRTNRLNEKGRPVGLPFAISTSATESMCN